MTLLQGATYRNIHCSILAELSNHPLPAIWTVQAGQSSRSRRRMVLHSELELEVKRTNEFVTLSR